MIAKLNTMSHLKSWSSSRFSLMVRENQSWPWLSLKRSRVWVEWRRQKKREKQVVKRDGRGPVPDPSSTSVIATKYNQRF